MAKTKFNYDYSKIIWMKMFLAKPDFPNNKSFSDNNTEINLKK